MLPRKGPLCASRESAQLRRKVDTSDGVEEPVCTETILCVLRIQIILVTSIRMSSVYHSLVQTQDSKGPADFDKKQ